MSVRLPNIVIAGNAPQEKCAMLNAMLSEEELSELCSILLYGADGEPEEDALNDAVEDCRDGKVEGVVCLPFNRAAIDVLKDCDGDDVQEAYCMYVNNVMRMTSVMGNMDLDEAEMRLTKEALMKHVRRVFKTLKRDFMILNPRIAVAAAKDAAIDEEKQKDIITIAISELEKEGIQVFGPVDVDAYFENVEYPAYDALVAVCDAQCIDKFEEVSDGTSELTLLSGIDAPVVASDYEGVLRALFLVTDIVRNRKEYDAPFANPLQKLYKERREDGDKARFAIKKKGFNPAEHRRENVNYTTIPKAKPNVTGQE